jgi:hypothetical protein
MVLLVAAQRLKPQCFFEWCYRRARTCLHYVTARDSKAVCLGSEMTVAESFEGGMCCVQSPVPKIIGRCMFAEAVSIDLCKSMLFHCFHLFGTNRPYTSQ